MRRQLGLGFWRLHERQLIRKRSSSPLVLVSVLGMVASLVVLTPSERAEAADPVLETLTDPSQGDGFSNDFALDDSGDRIVYFSTPNPGDNPATAWVEDISTGTRQILTDSLPGSVSQGITSFDTAISGDGNAVALLFDPQWLCFDPCLILYEATNGTFDPGDYQQINVGLPGAVSFGEQEPTLNQDGTLVAFQSSWRPDLQSPAKTDVFLRNTSAGTTEMVSVSSSDAQNSAGSPVSGAPEIAGNGRYVVFESNAPNFDPSDPDTETDVFVRDLQNGTTIRISAPGAGGSDSGTSFEPTISDDGRFISFISNADLTGTSGTDTDIFMVDRGASDVNGDFDPANYEIWLVTNNDSFEDFFGPSLSGNGQTLTYVDPSGASDEIVVYDVAARQEVHRLSTPNGFAYQLAIDGTGLSISFSDFFSGTSGINSDVYLYQLSPTAEQFVVVALGDSYQSGEGVGNSILDTAAYLNTAYENGSNYPEQIGPEEDTYSDGLSPGGNGCHRALANYAKINRDLYEPGADVVLIDETCSGARIEPNGKPPVVGTVDGGVAQDSQIQQAIDRLDSIGIGAADVDLITVGMGGNDAGFGDIVAGCLLPNLLRRVLEEYPDTPFEAQFVADHLASCWAADLFLFQTGPKVDALQAKEEWAQAQVLATFPNARILQLNYPNPLPRASDAPEWCGGIGREDIQYAREKVRSIDASIEASIGATGHPALELVDVEEALGANPLCPQDGAQALVNGFDEANVQAEIERLLDLPGVVDGDAIARQHLDNLADEYQEWRVCLDNDFNPFDGEDCDLGAEWSDVQVAFNSLLAYVQGQLPEIMANLIETPGPGAEPPAVRLDRTQGLFHPNAPGFEVLACNVRAAYAEMSADGCLSDPGLEFDTVDGEEIGVSPIDVIIDQILDVILNGFEANSPVNITFFSDAVDLGAVTADANGRVETSIQIPTVNPGVHRIQFAGTGANGVQVVKELKVSLGGDPVPGQPYGVYLCCFPAGTAEDGVIELVDVTFADTTFVALPDTEGGVYVEIPLPNDTADIAIEAVSQLTGAQITELVEVVNPGQLFLEWVLPSDPPPAFHLASAGSAVAIQFRVTDADGPIDDSSVIDLRTYPISCDSGEQIGGAESAEAAGPGLTYHGDGLWSFNWGSSPEFEDSCRTFSVVIDHGGRHDMWFDFRDPGVGECTITGTEGDDSLVGTSGDDIICGIGGNDTIHAGSGRDVVSGGPGDDDVFGGSGDDDLRGEGGEDLIDGGSGHDSLEGGSDADELYGGTGDDAINGSEGPDVILGGSGDDVLRGRDGDDSLEGGSGNDTLDGMAGEDSGDGGSGTDSCDVETAVNCEGSLSGRFRFLSRSPKTQDDAVNEPGSFLLVWQ